MGKTIKENLIPPELTPAQVAYTYANEADMLNVVLFGKTAKQWKHENPTVKGNMRDVVMLNQLLVLANLESYSVVLINQGKSQKECMELLRQLAVQQLQTLEKLSLNNLPKLAVDMKELERLFEDDDTINEMGNIVSEIKKYDVWYNDEDEERSAKHDY